MKKYKYKNPYVIVWDMQTSRPDWAKNMGILTCHEYRFNLGNAVLYNPIRQGFYYYKGNAISRNKIAVSNGFNVEFYTREKFQSLFVEVK